MPSSAEPNPSIAPSMRRALNGLFVIAAIAFLREARPLLLPIVIAVLFTFVLAPSVRRLHRVGVPEYVGAALVVSAVLAALVMIVLIVASPAAEGWSRAPGAWHALIDAAVQWRDHVWRPAFASGGAMPLPSDIAAAQPDAISGQLASEGLAITRLALGETLSFTLSSFASMMLLYFLLASEHWLVTTTLQSIPGRRTRARLMAGMREAQRDIGLFIRTMSLVNVALGIATGVALAAIGLPNALLWAVFTVVFSFVPYLGPAFIAIVLWLAGSVTFGIGFNMLAPPAAFLVLHGIEANFLSPLIMGHRLRIPALFVFVSVLVLGWLWGVAGAFIAVPVLLAWRSTCRRVSWGAAWCRYLEGGQALGAVVPTPAMPIAEPRGR